VHRQAQLEPEPAAETPEVSVIIPCRGDVAVMLREQLDALVAQDFAGHWEVLIADNGVSQSVRDLVTEYDGRLQIRIVPADDQPGRGYAINRGVLAARSSRLVMLDSDDIAAESYLSEVVDALGRHDFVGTRLDSEALNPSWLRQRRRPLQAHQLEYLLDHRTAVIGAGMALTRAAFDRVGGFDDELLTLEDLDVSYRLQEVGIRPFFAAAAVVQYRYRKDWPSLVRQERSYARGEAFLHRKHSGTLPRRHLRQTLRGWVDVLLAIPRMGTRAGRARLATTLGAAIGRVEGSLKYGVLHL
jgi:glycosyltransferase involved in cell wall biosynthesis